MNVKYEGIFRVDSFFKLNFNKIGFICAEFLECVYSQTWCEIRDVKKTLSKKIIFFFLRKKFLFFPILISGTIR